MELQGKARAGRLALGLLFATGLLASLGAHGATAATVTVTVTGAGSGTVTSSPGSIACTIDDGVISGTCSDAAIPNNTGVTMTASRKDGDSVFAGWTIGSGGCTGSASPCQFTTGLFGGTTSLTARFIKTPDPPAATTGPISPGPIGFLLTLNGSVNPRGFEVDECRFEFDSREYRTGEGPHGTGVPCVPGASELGEGEVDIAVSALAELEQLAPDTTYHYRLTASNLGGAVVGDDRTFTTGPAPLDGCQNAAIRVTQPLGAILLPDCMALEQVSPAKKDSQLTRTPSISADGDRVWFKATGALGEPPSFVNPLNTYYVASRTDEGWVTAPTAGSAEILGGANGIGQPLTFSPDFSRWLTIGSTQFQLPQGVSRAFLGGLGGLFEPLSPPLVPTTKGTNDTAVVSGTTFKGAAADLSHVYFSPGTNANGGGNEIAYMPGDPEPSGEGGNPNVYVAQLDSADEPTLELLARDGNGKVWGGRCGARIGGAGSATAATGRNQGAISADGARAYFSTRPTQPDGGICRVAEHPLRILERVEAPAGPEIKELFTTECARPPVPNPPGPCSTVDGDDFYEGASADRTKVYFTTNRQLVDSDIDGSITKCSPTTAVVGCDLYLYDSTRPVGDRLTQVSVGGNGDPTPGNGARVLKGVTAISTDGSHAYFVAQGVLTTDPNPVGDQAEAVKPNLYLWDEGTGSISFVATLHSADQNRLWGRAGAFVNDAYPVPAKGRNVAGEEIGGDGHVLFFLSNAELTGEDADGARRDAYRYDSDSTGPAALRCVSCRPGGPDSEPFDVQFRDRGGNAEPANEAGTDLTETRRWAGEDGGTVVFSTPESLLPGDANATTDAYLWRPEGVYRLPGGAQATLVVPTVSADGTEVAYSTFAPLLPFDRDSAEDVYVARAAGGYPNPPAPPVPCQSEEGCQGTAEASPAAPTMGSAGFVGPGNVKPKSVKPKPRPCPKGSRRVRRQGKARCVKAPQKGKHQRRDTDTDRRAAK